MEIGKTRIQSAPRPPTGGGAFFVVEQIRKMFCIKHWMHESPFDRSFLYTTYMAALNINQIFYDKKNRRSRYSRRTLVSAGAFLFVIFFVMIVSVVKSPLLPKLELKDPQLQYRAASNAVKAEGFPAAAIRQLPDGTVLKSAEEIRLEAEKNQAATVRPKVIAFYVNWDDNSFTSLKNNIWKIDELIPEWLHLGETGGDLLIDNQRRQDETLEFIRQNRGDLRVVPLINNFNEITQRWDTDRLVGMLSEESARKKAVEGLHGFVKSNKFAGINIDFEGVPDANQDELFLFMQELYAKFHPEGLVVTQDIPLDDDSFDIGKLSTVTDFLVLMAYDEHYAGGTPGPVSSRSWYSTALARVFSQVPPNKFIVALGGYGYDWTEGEAMSNTLSFQDAIRIARESEAQIGLESQSLNPTFDYYDEKNKLHKVWYLDATTVYNEMVIGRQFGNPHGFALWRIGSEDPSVWNVFADREKLDLSTVRKLDVMRYGFDLVYEGEGEILKAETSPHDGLRKITYNAQSGLITKESVLTYPSSYVITRWGGEDGKKVALTFDDGPDRAYTPKILDILKRYDVPATFFVVGVNANINTDILKRIYREGNEIGVHTYTHPDVSAITQRQFKLELDASQRLIESVLGRRSLLFRPPYAEDVEPATPDQVSPLISANSLGYYTIGMHIDPKDWSRPGWENIVGKTVEDIRAGKGNIVLLHDSGGDRSQTVEALPYIIEKLKEEGYQLVTVSDLMGIGRDGVMPMMSFKERLLGKINNAAFLMISYFSGFMRTMFMVGIFLGSLRFFYLSILAVAQRIRSKNAPYKKNSGSYAPSVSVIVPAFNEERVIVKTVEAILDSTYSDFNVIVVDDGSTDSTFDRVSAKFGNNPKVDICFKGNGGKSSALNFGIARTEAEIVVTLDADTLFRPDTMEKLVRAFVDMRVGAVAGNSKVGNRINILTKWQALEYITSQNIEKRAFEVMNCITVVPGAVGAWRREAVLEAGGFSNDTLAEDADLTFSILRSGKLVVFEDEAIGLTEAPDNTRDFIKQRFRWMYGTLQTAWKHRDTMFKAKYKGLGNFAVPNVFVFQVFFPLISPFMDLTIILSFFWVGWQKYSHPLSFSSSASFGQILVYYLLFLAMDFLTGMIPFFLEHRERWTLLFWLPLQRFYYRQLMYYVAIKAFFTAVMGKIVGWNKFERKATVESAVLRPE